MSDDGVPADATPDDVPGDPQGDVEDASQRRGELLAMLLVAGAVGDAMSVVLTAIDAARFGRGAGGAIDWGDFLRTASRGGNLLTSLLLVAALAFIVLSPGDRIGSTGTGVLNVLSILGVVVAAMALIAFEETVRYQPTSQALGGGNALGFVSQSIPVLTRLGDAIPFVPAAALAAFVGWWSWRILNEVSRPSTRG